jgi:site-specific DNA-methyltransferase (adenine-specific)
MGNLWSYLDMSFESVTIGPCTLYRGDCRDVLPTLSGVDAVVTDPPYGVHLGGPDIGRNGRNGKHGLEHAAYNEFEDTYEHFVSDVVPRLKAALTCASRAAVFTGPHIHEQAKPDAIGGVYCSAASGRHCWGFKNLLPVLFYGTAAGLQNGARFPTAIASNATADRNGHPCPKPLAWMEWLVNLASLRGETVLDPFMGSGTTGEACIRLGRQFIGVERDSEYFDIACKRIEQAWRDERSKLPMEQEPQIVQPALFE